MLISEYLSDAQVNFSLWAVDKLPSGTDSGCWSRWVNSSPKYVVKYNLWSVMSQGVSTKAGTGFVTIPLRRCRKSSMVVLYHYE